MHLSNRLLILLILLLVSMMGATAFFVVTSVRTIPANQETDYAEVDDDKTDDSVSSIESNIAYQEAQAKYQDERKKPFEEQNLQGVVALYAEAASDAVSYTEQTRALFMAATVLSEYDPVAGVQSFRAIAEDEGVPQEIRAAAIESMVVAYRNSQREDVFSAIFSGTYEQHKVIVGSQPAVDESLQKLLEYGSTLWPLATIELRLASSRIDRHIDSLLQQKLVDHCRQPGSVVNNMCTPDIELLLTPEERTAYTETQNIVRDHLTRAEKDIVRFKERNNSGILVRALGMLASVQGKALLYGIGNPAEVEQSFRGAILAAQAAGDIDVEARTVLNYAVFVRLWWWDDREEAIAKIKGIITPLYTDSRYLSSDFIPSLQAAYQAELFSHSDTSAEILRGPLMLTTTDESFRAYLVNELGWDFEHPAIRAFFEE